ncbi:DEAD-domain-containing protein [Acaromyces ingoldii]|uniref:DEAD-domain-containing protein n=1 Tax=Acaromyces ingoldii TaxID=215250 RepID=A0A316YQT6_9BASI|nr:DEAD-domain-containing protein [Acaromyces ingoldii]PWN91910.1 DEAD-domain-containing protein [Acaromyces ingoldii]
MSNGKGKKKEEEALRPKAKTFGGLGLSSLLVRSLAHLSITTPTAIQAESIPLILSGNDLIGGSPTGSGKTLSFALPILQKLQRDMVGGYAVVLTPTRELAVQLHEQFVAVGAGADIGLRVSLVLGGMDMLKQSEELSRGRPHIIVATPGRLVDILKSGAGEDWGLQRCKFVVLDEADRLLTATFGPELSYLFGVLPPARARQTLLFTATLTPEIEQLANKEPEPGEKKPVLCKIEQDTSTPEKLRQKYIFVPSHMREPFLLHLLEHAPTTVSGWTRHKKGEESEDEDEEDEGSKVPPTIIFCARAATAQLLSLMLKELGIGNVALHSKMSQPMRLQSLDTFRARSVPILITTDLGSRGLDVPDVAMVVNWDLPRDWRDYVHRVGRTARNNKEGVSVSFVGERDVELLQGIEKKINVEMVEHSMNEERVLEKLNAVMTAKRVASMQMHDSHFGERDERNKRKAELRNKSVEGKPPSSKKRRKKEEA